MEVAAEILVELITEPIMELKKRAKIRQPEELKVLFMAIYY